MRFDTIRTSVLPVGPSAYCIFDRPGLCLSDVVNGYSSGAPDQCAPTTGHSAEVNLNANKHLLQTQ